MPGHLDVEDGEVGPQVADQLDGLVAAAGLAHDLVALLLEGLLEVEADDGLVLGDHARGSSRGTSFHRLGAVHSTASHRRTVDGAGQAQAAVRRSSSSSWRTSSSAISARPRGPRAGPSRRRACGPRSVLLVGHRRLRDQGPQRERRRPRRRGGRAARRSLASSSRSDAQARGDLRQSPFGAPRTHGGNDTTAGP